MTGSMLGRLCAVAALLGCLFLAATIARADESAASYWQAERARQERFSGHPEPSLPERAYASASAAIWQLVAKAADAHGVPRAVAIAIVRQESGGRCNARNGHAIGLMQLMPGTARALGVRNRFDCAENLDGGIRMLASIGQRHGWSCASLGLYERGEAAVPLCTGYGRRVLALMRQAERG